MIFETKGTKGTIYSNIIRVHLKLFLDVGISMRFGNASKCYLFKTKRNNMFSNKGTAAT